MTVKKRDNKRNSYGYKDQSDYDLEIKKQEEKVEVKKDTPSLERLLIDGFVTVPRLNVRTGPGFSFKVIKIVNQGERLFVSKQEEDEKGELWYQIIMNISPDDIVAKEGEIGYVKGEFVELK